MSSGTMIIYLNDVVFVCFLVITPKGVHTTSGKISTGSLQRKISIGSLHFLDVCSCSFGYPVF
jgi:hypothetical protein